MRAFFLYNLVQQVWLMAMSVAISAVLVTLFLSITGGIANHGDVPAIVLINGPFAVAIVTAVVARWLQGTYIASGRLLPNQRMPVPFRYNVPEAGYEVVTVNRLGLPRIALLKVNGLGAAHVILILAWGWLTFHILRGDSATWENHFAAALVFCVLFFRIVWGNLVLDQTRRGIRMRSGELLWRKKGQLLWRKASGEWENYSPHAEKRQYIAAGGILDA